MQVQSESNSRRRAPSLIRAELQTASLAADVQTMERLLREGAKGHGDSQEFLLPLARLLEELSRPEDALEIWQASFAESPSLESAYQIMRHGSAVEGQGIADQIERCFSTRARRAVDALLYRGPLTPRHDARHLAICGTSYSGSTLLGRFLDSLDGFHDVGESHWLIDQKELTGGKRQIDFFTRPPSPTRRYCRQCGERCEILTTDFRIELQLHRCQWYGRLAERVGTSILVSSDKNSAKYLTLDPRLRFDAIVLFKSPEAAWHSVLKRLGTDDPDEVTTRLERFLAVWIREYENALAMTPEGKKLFLHFDSLAANPRRIVSRLLEALDLPNHDLDLDKTMSGRHAIGGNDDFVDASSKTERIDVKTTVDRTLPEAHRRLIADDERSASLFDDLSSRSNAVFGPPFPA